MTEVWNYEVILTMRFLMININVVDLGIIFMPSNCCMYLAAISEL